MSAPAWTPGPWTTELGPERLWLKVVNVSLDQTVCRMPERAWTGGADSRKADARLIAAAPDLYAALEDCRRWICGAGEIEGAPIFDRIDAALAKAREAQ